ncbi:MAG: outer membrane protein assembly factor BamE [Zetaproteobacteria bacterium]|nr:MAG: outer membrane protein assembly factor BamE [Zetaproteobacteria bacterium]
MRRLWALALVAGCQHLPMMQGNVLDEAKVRALHPGMTKAEVVELLGEPVLHDPLRPQTMFYVEDRDTEHGRVRRAVIVRLDRNGRVRAIEKRGF